MENLTKYWMKQTYQIELWKTTKPRLTENLTSFFFCCPRSWIWISINRNLPWKMGHAMGDGNVVFFFFSILKEIKAGWKVWSCGVKLWSNEYHEHFEHCFGTLVNDRIVEGWATIPLNAKTPVVKGGQWLIYLVVSIQLKSIHQNGNLPQV